jgi:hypothetical protein
VLSRPVRREERGLEKLTEDHGTPGTLTGQAMPLGEARVRGQYVSRQIVVEAS